MAEYNALKLKNIPVWQGPNTIPATKIAPFHYPTNQQNHKKWGRRRYDKLLKLNKE